MRPEGPWQRLAAALADSSGVLIHTLILAQTDNRQFWYGTPFSCSPIRQTMEKSPSPHPQDKGIKNVAGYRPGGPGPPSSPSSPEPVLTPESSGSFRSALTQPTLVSLRKASTASVDLSFHSHLPEGALGCFHSWAFPMSFHSRLICGFQALHSVNRWWRVCCLSPPHHQHRSSSVLWILSFR